MAVYSIERVQCIPASLEKVWDFFADPARLSSITPPSMQFQVISRDRGDRIYAGQIIEYRLRPLPWLRVCWMTEITHVKQGVYFVDEQRRGPYSLWHHQHHFRDTQRGVEMTDIVHYEIPFGFIGSWVNGLFVKRQLKEIFRYRFERVEEIFGRCS
jgi:ligand-binding SRPBCC domain-containing protein